LFAPNFVAMFLLIYAHPDPESFNAAIKSEAIKTLEAKKQAYKLIDLCAEKFDPVLSKEEMKSKATSDEVKRYREMIKEASTLVFIFPVWWFRAPAILEGFLDKVFVPGFAYRFKQIIGKYGVPIPLLKDKHVLTIVTHGAPALPVKTLYVNAVKYRFLLGFLSFCFNVFKCKIVQLWAVPFVSEKKRKQYLNKMARLIERRIP
jgi:NAD(P)H dehydrogenase (quinone)